VRSFLFLRYTSREEKLTGDIKNRSREPRDRYCLEQPCALLDGWRRWRAYYPDDRWHGPWVVLHIRGFGASSANANTHRATEVWASLAQGADGTRGRMKVNGRRASTPRAPLTSAQSYF